MSRRPERIAVVGLGGVFPGAATLDAFWESIAARRCAAKPVPQGRWSLSPDQAFDPRKPFPDKVYSLNACLIEGFDFPQDGLDPMFHLGLHAARQAFSGVKADKARTGVIIGNIVLPTDSASRMSRELLEGKPLTVDERNRYVAGLPAGMIARELGLGGTAFALDAACASSLYALRLACAELRAGRADVMITGGLSRPESLYTQMGFSQLRALSARGIPAPFDANGDGLVVGEGAGMLALKRHDDALRDGDKIWGLIAGAGLSNDVGGSLLAPNTVGQLRAMRAAYQEAGWSPADVGYVECHATGTPTGDPVETASLKALWGERGWTAGQCALGSVKSNVGHMLTAAGAAGLIKMLLAFEKKTLPPSANFERENPALGLAGSPFRVQKEAQPWDAERRRAAVSGFGFGGINAHVLIEEPEAKPARRRARPKPTPPPAVAIVGMEARFGSLPTLRHFQETVLSGRPVDGTLMKEVGVNAADFRVPPREIEEMLPQQLLMLDASRAAIADAKLPQEGRENCGVFIGISFDMNACNFSRRWAAAAESRDRFGPALNANRTMGALGGIVASRVAREFQIGGPSFTLSCEQTSGLRALETAVRLLQQGELEAAVVGAVEVADPRQPYTGDGAACLVLKRLDDALKAGDRVYAAIRGVGAARDAAEALRRAYKEAGVDPTTVGLHEGPVTEGLVEVYGTAKSELPCALGDVRAQLGDTGAASGLASLVKAALALYQEILPPSVGIGEENGLSRARKRFHRPRRAQAWVRNRAEGQRRAAVSAVGVDGGFSHVVLEGAEPGAETPRTAAERRQPLGARAEALFALEADDSDGLIAGTAELGRWLASQEEGAGIEALARRWLVKQGQSPAAAKAIAFVARSAKELAELLARAETSLREDPSRPIAGERVHFTYREPFGPKGVAFVFPGSGNQYLGMGASLGVEFPEILRALDAEHGYLRRQLVPERFVPWRFDWKDGWEKEAEAELSGDYPSMIFGSVSHGAVVSDLVRGFAVSPRFAIGYSLGETASLFALRAWNDRDEMLRRMSESSLFVSDLAGPCDAARQFWNLPTDERVEWVLGVIDRPAPAVRQALKGMERAALLIVNAPLECVVGGYKKAVESLVEGMGCVFLPLQGVSTVHFPAAKLVEKKYRDLHLLPTSAPEGVSFYSGVWGKPYEVTREAAADSITAQAVRGFDYSAVIRRAYDDGARIFIEMGPSNSCTRMIGKILGPLPHVARAACWQGQDEAGSVLRLLAQLIAERVPVDLKRLYGGVSHAVGHQPPAARPTVFATLGPPKPARAQAAESTPAAHPMARETPRADPPAVSAAPVSNELVAAFVASQDAAVKAHESYLAFSAQLTRLLSGQAVVEALPGRASPEHAPGHVPRSLTREQCLEFAVGSIAKVLGPRFAAADSYPTRVRLPDEPLMLVDRVVELEGEPQSMTKGRVVTEHDVKKGAWYLDNGRIPTCVAVEAGQADLFLSGYLGIDDQTKGLAVYRLLDAEIVFHGALPKAGDVIRYDIRIERFVKHGDSWLFFFNYDGTVDGRPLITMRNGCAGFFSQQELAAGKGVVLTEDDVKPLPGKKPAGWAPRLCDAPLSPPLPGGKLSLVHRVLELQPEGGRHGLGRVFAEADIHPDDWHLVCHFKDDNVMPGTLMYECCLHAMRHLLGKLGFHGDAASCHWEPKPGVRSKLKCRGQVLASTKKVHYEVVLKEIGLEPHPYALADALMYSDGKPIVHITDMSLQLTGARRKPLFDHDRILAFAVGKPSEAFGEPYKVFDEDRIIARLPGPPYQFLDRIVDIQGCEPFKLSQGGRVIAEYDVPRDAWYFKSHGQPTMPFSVLLEVALQPCGWLAAYLGSALTSPVDLKFRNLGGTATQRRDVRPDSGTLRTEIHITKVAQSGGMIIQDFTMKVTDAHGIVYEGVTEFGFFTAEALGQQVGVRGAKPFEPSAAERSRLIRPSLEDLWPAMPDSKLLLLDECALSLDGGPKGLGFALGKRRVNPSEWFFKAHFYQDPVCPGSLGLESFLELLKAYAAVRWPKGARYECMALGKPHTWLYRGQYTPVNKDVEVRAVITSVDEASRTVKADGYLSVDGLTIYGMKDFSVRLCG